MSTAPPLTPAQARLGCFGLLLATLPVLVTLALGLLFGADIAMLVGAATAVALALLWLLTERRSLRGWLLPASIGLGLGVALVLPTFVAHDLVASINRLSGRWPVVEVAAAPATTAELFEVRGGTVQHELAQRTSTPRRNDVTIRVVAPLVGRHWTRSEPVTVWLACSPNEGSEARAEEECLELFTGSPVGRPAGDSFAPTIAAAERRHGLRSAPNAVVLRLTDAPTANAWGDLAFASVLVMVAAALAVTLSQRRGRAPR